MAESVLMPKAGISVESCIVGEWKKKVGDAVAVGDVLFDYETDKAAFECESTAAGTLLAILFAQGEEVPVLLPVCVVGQPGEDIGAFTAAAAAPVAEAAALPERTVLASAHAKVTSEYHVHAASQAGVSPRARALAKELNLDPANAAGTGPDGRVIERDIQALAAMPAAEAKPAAAAKAASVAVIGSADFPTAAYKDEKMPRIRQSIARAMHASLAGMAQLTHHHSFDASAILALRAEFKNRGGDMGLAGVTLGDMVLYATVKTLMKHKNLNANLLDGDVLRTFEGVHLGVAVDTERGLMVPTVFDADRLSLVELSDKVKELAALCRGGSISPDLLAGGTFTVSNLGNLGVEMFTPIINPPQVAILGVCCSVERPRTGKDGAVGLYPAMGLSLTYDHRGVDGAPASRFLRDLSASLERFPLLLAL